MHVIALLTDFGLKDGFVGAMKGVIKSINPTVEIVDITHEIEPFDIFQGALTLYSVYRYFPPYTIFVAVVDPGVGTKREPIIVETEKYIFVLPNNGLISFVQKYDNIRRVILIENSRFMLNRISETFHGRDIFAPVASFISRGVPLNLFGKEKSPDSLVKIPIPEPKVYNDKIEGEIISFDRFGNAITNIKDLPEHFTVIFRDYKIADLKSNFLEGEKDKPNLIVGSTGFLEIFLPQDSFKNRFNAKRGEKVIVKEEE